MSMQVTVDQARLRAIRARMKEVGDKGMAREMNKALKLAALPIAQQEKSAALALPAAGSVSTGLRQGIADAVKISVLGGKRNAGVRIRSKSNLAKASTLNRWRHPVFGNRSNWVQQTLQPGWFSRTAYRNRAQVKAEIHAILDVYAKKIGV